MRRWLSTLSRPAERRPLVAAIGDLVGAANDLFATAAVGNIGRARVVACLGVLLVVLMATACGFAIDGGRRLENVASIPAVLVLATLAIVGGIFLTARRFAPKNHEAQFQLDAVLNHLPQRSEE